MNWSIPMICILRMRYVSRQPLNYKDYFDERIHLIEVKNFGRAINVAKDFAAFLKSEKLQMISDLILSIFIHLRRCAGRFAFKGKKVPLFTHRMAIVF